MGRHGGRDRGGLPRDEYDRKERELKEGRSRSHSASSIIEGRVPFPHHVRNLDFRGLAGYRAVRSVRDWLAGGGAAEASLFSVALTGIGRVEPKWDQRFESSFLQRRVSCEREAG